MNEFERWVQDYILTRLSFDGAFIVEFHFSFPLSSVYRRETLFKTHTLSPWKREWNRAEFHWNRDKNRGGNEKFHSFLATVIPFALFIRAVMTALSHFLLQNVFISSAQRVK